MKRYCQTFVMSHVDVCVVEGGLECIQECFLHKVVAKCDVTFVVVASICVEEGMLAVVRWIVAGRFGGAIRQKSGHLTMEFLLRLIAEKVVPNTSAKEITEVPS